MLKHWFNIELREVMKLDLARVHIDPGLEYPMVGVYSFGRGLFLKEPVLGQNTSYKFYYRLKSDHVVMSQLFGWEGAIALSSKKYAGLFVSPQFPTFLCDPEKIDRDYLGWFMREKRFWEELGRHTKGMGDRRRTLTPESLLRMEIPLPPLDEQRRIVAHIEALTARVSKAISLKERAMEETDALIKTSLNILASELEQKYETKLLEELMIDANYGTSVKCHSERENGAIPVLRIPNVRAEKVTLRDLKYGILNEVEYKKTVLHKGDILVVRTNGSADLVGRSAVVSSLPEPMTFASYMIRIQCDKKIIAPEFMQIFFRQQRTGGFLIDFARTTAGQYNVSLGRLRKMKVSVPPLEVQHRIIAHLDDVQAKVNELRRLQDDTREELSAMMPSILDRAFKGEL